MGAALTVTTTLFHDLTPGQRIVLADNLVVITLEQKTGRRARLRFDVDEAVSVHHLSAGSIQFAAHECSPLSNEVTQHGSHHRRPK